MTDKLDQASIELGTTGANASPWPGEWLRGLMEVCVLRAVADGPTYGYAIALALEAAGLGAPKGGTLYPLLGRLEKAGWVGARWGAGDGGPGRKFYELTDAGRAHLAVVMEGWGRFSERVSHFLTTCPTAAPAAYEPLTPAAHQTEGDHHE